MFTLFELMANLLLRLNFFNGFMSDTAVKIALGTVLCFVGYILGLRLFMYIKKHSSVLVPVLLASNAISIYMLIERL